jgi:hypothetical protein
LRLVEFALAFLQRVDAGFEQIGGGDAEPPSPMGQPAVQPMPAFNAGVGVSDNEREAVLQRVEQLLDDLQAALGARDMRCIELHAGEVQRALAQAIERFRHAARRGGTPLELRRRLALAGAQVAAQRDALARATAALDRGIDVLMPSSGASVYSFSGSHAPRRSPTALEA